VLQGHVRTLVAVVACISAFAMVAGLASPLLSLILESRGTSRSWIGLNAAMPAFGTLVASPFIPALAKRLGIKRLLLLCLAFECVLFLLLKVFDHLYFWFVIRFFMGASTAGLFICSETWINTLAPDNARGKIIAAYTAILAACMAMGPLVIARTSIHGWLPFLFGAVFVLVAMLPLIWASAVIELESHKDDPFGIVSFVRIAPLIAAGVFVFAFMEYTSFSLLPVFSVRSGLTEKLAVTTLAVFGFGRVFLQLPIGLLADRMDRSRLLIYCVAFAGVCAALLPFVVSSIVAMMGLLFLLGGFVNGINTVSLTLIGERFRGSELATASAGVGVLWGIASLIGPAITGVAMDLYDPEGFVIVMVVLSAVFVVSTVRKAWS